MINFEPKASKFGHFYIDFETFRHNFGQFWILKLPFWDFLSIFWLFSVTFFSNFLVRMPTFLLFLWPSYIVMLKIGCYLTKIDVFSCQILKNCDILAAWLLLLCVDSNLRNKCVSITHKWKLFAQKISHLQWKQKRKKSFKYSLVRKYLYLKSRHLKNLLAGVKSM